MSAALVSFGLVSGLTNFKVTSGLTPLIGLDEVAYLLPQIALRRIARLRIGRHQDRPRHLGQHIERCLGSSVLRWFCVMSHCR